MRARSASAERRDTWVTSALTSVATTRNVTSAMRFSPSAMVKVWIGSVKNQLTDSDETTAATRAGQSPPTMATTTTSTRKSSMSVGRLSVPCTW